MSATLATGARSVRSRHRLQLHFRQHFEHGGVLQVRARAHRDRLDARAAGGIQLLARHRFGERGAHEVVDDLAVHLLAVLLADDRERRLARAEALEPRGARNLVEPLRDFAVDLRRGDRHFEAAFESARGGQRNLHINSLSSSYDAPANGAKGETRTLTGYPTGT